MVDGSRVNLFEEPGHVLAQGFHRPDAFRIVFYFSWIPTDPHIPVTRARNDHLVEQEKIVHRTENMGGAGTTDSDDGCSYLAFEQVSIGARDDCASLDEADPIYQKEK